MPSLGSIATLKEQEQTYPSLLLCAFTFQDGTVLRVGTDGLNAGEGGFRPTGITGFPHNDQDFFARIETQDLAAVQAMSQDGIDQSPSHTAHFADADKFVYLNYERTKGFKGASLSVYLVFWEPGTANFSSDYMTKFVGICGSPTNIVAKGMQVAATSKLNMQKILLPTFPIQPRCPLAFPPATSYHQDAADNSDSPFYACGYSPTASGGNARGNAGFTSCTYTKSACQARGMYAQDSSARHTGRFAGVQWDPPTTWRGKSYTEGKTIEGVNTSNYQKYSQFVPLVYGTSFVDAVAANWQGDGNSSRGEFIVCSGFVPKVYKVICNDVLIPDNNSPNRAPDPLFRWQWVNQGTRDGAPNADAGFDGLGDPYGSMAVIEVVVPRKLSDSSSIPRVRVLIQAPSVRVYNSGVPTVEPSESPIWNMLDAFTRGPARYSDVDIASCEIAASVCGQTINFTNLGGVTASHERYKTSLAITNRQSLSEIIRGLRASCKAMIVPAATGAGLIQIFIKQTLAQQQPSAIAGSNYNTPIASRSASGAAADGYAAYDFNESNIIAGSFTLTQRTVADSPNVRTGTLQDNENDYVNDSYRIVDSVDIGRNGNQEVSTQLQIAGANSYDQVLRCAETDAAETYRGNERGDSGGTIVAVFKTTAKCAHLKAGQIVQLAEQQHSLGPQLFRVMKIEPSAKNFEESSLTLQWHEDEWYLDSYGQGADPYHSGSGKQQLARPPYGWQPSFAAPRPSDMVVPQEEATFALAQSYEALADGTVIAKLDITGAVPVNKLSSIGVPLIGQQGTTASTGGVIAGGQVIYAVVCAYNADGQGAPSPVTCTIGVPSATNTNTVTIPVVAWPPDTVGYQVYAGPNPNTLTFQKTATGTPASITIGATFWNVLAYGRPDVMFDHFEMRVKRSIHSGVWGAAISSVTATTLTFLESTFTVNEWAGHDLTVLGISASTSILQINNLRILSNTADTLTVSLATPDLVTVIGLKTGDVVVMRTKPDTVSANTIGDSKFINSFDPVGLTPDAEIGNFVRILYGTGRGQVRKIIGNTDTVLTVDRDFDTVPAADSVFIVEESAYQVVTHTTPTQNSQIAAFFTASIDVTNYKNQQLLIQVFTSDSEGNDSFEQDTPIREMYIFGEAGTVLADSVVQISYA